MAEIPGPVLRGSAVVIATVGLTVSACGASAPPKTPVPQVSVLNLNSCGTPPRVASPRPSPRSTARPQTDATYTARIVTNCGTIIVLLDGRHARKVVANFRFLAGRGFFTDVPCLHLLTPSAGSSVLQCGQPHGPAAAEVAVDPASEPLAAGTLGSDPGDGAQFVLTFARSRLPRVDVPFGQVVAGLDVLTRIAKAGAARRAGSAPRQPVVIESIGVTTGGSA